MVSDIKFDGCELTCFDPVDSLAGSVLEHECLSRKTFRHQRQQISYTEASSSDNGLNECLLFVNLDIENLDRKLGVFWLNRVIL